MKMDTYTLPVADETWEVTGQPVTTIFDWDYADSREKMRALYQKGKDRQWDATKRIDWTRAIDPENPLGIRDEFLPIHGSPTWARLDDRTKGEVRRHMAGWQFSQFLHGEQGALVCTAKIVQTVPDIDAKFYAGTQVIDEARHVETYSRYLREKLDLAYPLNRHLGALLQNVIDDRRWDFTYLGMQIIIEGLALAAFASIRDNATEPTAREINAYVMQDEARHVAFGRLALRDYYPQLTEAERREREDFAVDACWLMRDRFLAEEVWGNLGFDVAECTRFMRESDWMKFYQGGLFMRIVPTLKDIGLWGKKVQDAFVAMGVMQFAAIDPEEANAQDEATADHLERELHGRPADA